MDTNTNVQKVAAVLESGAEAAIQALLDDEEVVFWVDWREQEVWIVEYCETILKTGSLSATLVEVAIDEGYEIYIDYRSKRSKIPLSYSPYDRYITICALNEALTPDYEVRFCIDSDGGDTLAFIPLPQDVWSELERRYGEKVGRHFDHITESFWTG